MKPGSTPTLERATFRTSRLLDFCSRKELIAQTGHQPDAWPLVALKELVDNSLDACEETGVAPEIEVTVDNTGITVADNGPGIPENLIDDVLDFSIRVSSREAYVAPDRGAQGNALKTIFAMPFVLDGEEGRVTVAAGGQRHTILFSVDAIRQKPVIEKTSVAAENATNGTTITIHWPDSASSVLEVAKARFLQIADDAAWFNPHLTLRLDWFGETKTIAAAAADWIKWRPSDPTSPHWYTPQHLERLVAGYIAHDADTEHDRTVREFISEFRGLSGSAKQKKVLEATGLARTGLVGLCNGRGVDSALIGPLLDAMKANTKPVKPPILGIIGKDHLETRFKAAGCEMGSFQYRKVQGTDDGVPWVAEAAFGWCPEAEGRRLVAGVNWSAGIINPFRELGRFGNSLDTVLSQARADRDEPVILFLHLARARVEYTDRGKSAVVIEEDAAAKITEAVTTVTKKWTKQRKAEERKAGAILRRREAISRQDNVRIIDAAYNVMEAAYLKASANGTLPALARQIMYAARAEIQERIGQTLKSDYFTQHLLPDYMTEYGLEDTWNVVFDARGHLHEPHTKVIVPLGTLDVRNYLAEEADQRRDLTLVLPTAATFPTLGPGGRYSAILFIEKEGFTPLFQETKLAQRYDIAIMSTKGMSVTAARELVDHLCAAHDIPLLVLHDFDKSGFSIVGTLQRDSRR